MLLRLNINLNRKKFRRMLMLLANECGSPTFSMWLLWLSIFLINSLNVENAQKISAEAQKRLFHLVSFNTSCCLLSIFYGVACILSQPLKLKTFSPEMNNNNSKKAKNIGNWVEAKKKLFSMLLKIKYQILIHKLFVWRMPVHWVQEYNRNNNQFRKSNSYS